MPTLPANPVPRVVSPPEIVDPILTQVFDQGHEHRRSRYSRSRRRYTLEYLVNADELHTLTDFFERETRAGALSFGWSHPYQHTITTITNNIPNIVFTSIHHHGYQDNQQVNITGTLFHNGLYTIKYFAYNAFLLLGTSGGTVEQWPLATSPARASLYFPTMALVAAEMIPAARPREGFGAYVNDSGLLDFTIVLEEKFV